MKLSIVELATVSPGSDVETALEDAIVTTQHAEAHGFERVWFAEHHGGASAGSSTPEVLIAAAGARTSTIRIGSGTVLLNNYSPYKVAETFQVLEALYPGRIDLGLGRATSGQIIDAALLQVRSARPADDHPERLAEVLAWLNDSFPADHPFSSQPLMPTVEHRPEPWLLGSSPDGSNLAAELGIRYCFAGFINPNSAAGALRNYRDRFAPGLAGETKPRAMLAVNVTVGEDESDARRMVSSAKGFYAKLGRDGAGALIPTPEQALRETPPELLAEPTVIEDGFWPRFVAGDADQVKATLDQMVEESGADELMIQNLIADPDDRRASHARLAAMFELSPR